MFKDLMEQVFIDKSRTYLIDAITKQNKEAGEMLAEIFRDMVDEMTYGEPIEDKETLEILSGLLKEEHTPEVQGDIRNVFEYIDELDDE